MTVIFSPWNTGLGDQFATINLMLRLASRSPERIYLSRLQNGQDLGPLHDEIRSLLACNAPLDSVQEPGNTPLSGYDVWRCDYYPTRLQWKSSNRHRHIVYCFESASSIELKDPPGHDRAAIMATILDTGLPSYRIGKHLGLTKSAELAAGAAFFVGVDSGPSHVCHSIGLPMFLLEYKLGLETCHRGRAYTRCEGAEDFRIKLGRWRDYRTFIGAGW